MTYSVRYSGLYLVALGKLFSLHPCASVTKQYNLVPANGSDQFGWESNRGPGEK